MKQYGLQHRRREYFLHGLQLLKIAAQDRVITAWNRASIRYIRFDQQIGIHYLPYCIAVSLFPEIFLIAQMLTSQCCNSAAVAKPNQEREGLRSFPERRHP